MKRLALLLPLLALSLAFAAPAWALVDLNLSAEYVAGGKADASGRGKSDLKGGILLRAMASVLGFTGGLESYTDTVKDGDQKLTELALKAGYGIGLPGADLTLLGSYEDWKITDIGGAGLDLQLKDALIGVDAVVTLLPVFDVEGWYSTSVSSDVAGAYSKTLTSVKGSGFNYGVRLVYKVAMGFGVSAGYRAEEHKIKYTGGELKLDTSGYTLGIDYRF